MARPLKNPAPPPPPPPRPEGPGPNIGPFGAVAADGPGPNIGPFGGIAPDGPGPNIRPFGLKLTAQIVSAHVANNQVPTADLPELLTSVHGALSAIVAPPSASDAAPAQKPAVPVRSSIKQDYIVCLEDGAKLKMLKRYLRTRFDMTPEAYRTKWGLPKDYPMVAPAYAEHRRKVAKEIGLGQSEKAKVPAPKAGLPKGRRAKPQS